MIENISLFSVSNRSVCTFFMATAFLLFSAQADAATETPIETTVEAVKANPTKFDKKIIRVRGVQYGCDIISCLLCAALPGELPKEPAKCLSSTFLPLDFGGNWRKDLQRAEYVFREMMQIQYRYAEITAEGRYSSECDLGMPLGHCISFIIDKVLIAHKWWPARMAQPPVSEAEDLREAPADLLCQLVPARRTWCLPVAGVRRQHASVEMDRGPRAWASRCS